MTQYGSLYGKDPVGITGVLNWIVHLPQGDAGPPQRKVNELFTKKTRPSKFIMLVLLNPYATTFVPPPFIESALTYANDLRCNPENRKC